MDSEPETREKIKQTVIEILKEADLKTMTEHAIRELASAQLGIDLSEKERKRFVRELVESYLKNLAEAAEESDDAEQKAEGEAAEEKEEEEEEEDDQKKQGGAEYDDNGDLVICRLSDKRKVTIQDFRGKRLVSIREFYRKDGKELPSNKGISLSEEQWSVFKKNVPAIEEAIREMM